MANDANFNRRAADGKIDEIEQRLENIEQMLLELKHYEEMLEKHDKLLMGNGSAGLKTQLEVLTQKVDGLMKINYLLFGTIITAIILAVINHVIDI